MSSVLGDFSVGGSLQATITTLILLFQVRDLMLNYTVIVVVFFNSAFFWFLLFKNNTAVHKSSAKFSQFVHQTADCA